MLLTNWLLAAAACGLQVSKVDRGYFAVQKSVCNLHRRNTCTRSGNIHGQKLSVLQLLGAQSSISCTSGGVGMCTKELQNTLVATNLFMSLSIPFCHGLPTTLSLQPSSAPKGVLIGAAEAVAGTSVGGGGRGTRSSRGCQGHRSP